jgi:hypothetical protein
VPRAERQDWTCEYENLLLLTSQLNLKKGKRKIPDPCQYNLAKCLRIHLNGTTFGQIEPLNETGKIWEGILRLNSEDAVDEREKLIGILRSVAQNDESLFRQLIGYPKSLPDLEAKVALGNSRPKGTSKCAYSQYALGCLPDYY